MHLEVMAGGGLQKAASALAAADGVAHIAFFAMFAWRTVMGSGFRVIQALWAFLALLGMGSGAVGWALMRGPNRGPTRRVGSSALALSTALAAFLLMVASNSEN
ncbi:MAG: hypothetical protein ACRELY_06440 [Polyangiaceae bacterium]